MHVRRLVLLCLLATPALVPARAHCADGAAGELRVSLRAQATVRQRLIVLGDIADIRCADDAAGRRAAALDLAELDPMQPTIPITRTLVHARLLLAGFAPGSVRFSGAETVEVRLSSAVSAEQRVVDTAQQAIARRLSLPPDEVVIRLAQPLTEELAQLVTVTPAEGLEVRVPSGHPGGRTRVELWTSDGEGGRRVTPVTVDVRFRQLVPVAARALQPRRMLTLDDVVMEERELVQRAAWLDTEQIEGKSLRRPLASGEIVTARDLVVASAEAEPVLVKPRDVVRMTARKGTLILVVPAAEALQPGREGELIRVRNPSSGKIVIARVVGPGEVEVPL